MMKFENWMVGKKVKEISSGDIGTVAYDYGPSRIYVDWETGDMAGCQLHIGLDGVEFLQDDVSERLAKMENTLAEVLEELRAIKIGMK